MIMAAIIRKLAMPVAVVGFINMSVPVAASTWFEVGDAGKLPATAQVTVGSGPLTAISGAVETNDADLFQISITGTTPFSAATNGELGSAADPAFDTQLFLFNSDGLAVAGNDDHPGGSPGGSPFHSQILPISLTAGIYYLGISGFNNDPQSAGGAMFPSFLFNAQYGPADGNPTGPGAGDPLSGWSDSGDSGDYFIGLQGASFAVSVPEPITLLLMGLGLAGLGIGSRRRIRICPRVTG